ncbi:MAG: HAMP domain-containing protein [Desulfobacteraceae bacterium]|nr:MAG: HAMP domain-containing protein [Desulfobacteraceae bacterium]
MAEKIRFGISQKLLTVLMLVALIPLTCVWFFSYQGITTLNRAKVNQQLAAINERLITHTDGWVDMNQRMLLQNSSLVDMQSMEKKRQDSVLKTMTQYYNWAYLAFSTDEEGNNIGRSDGKKTRFYGDRDYFKQVVNGHEFGQQILIGKTSGKPAIVLSTGIFSETGLFKGVLAVAMTLEELSDKIINNRIGKTGFSFLVDERSEVIAHPNADMAQQRVDMSDHPALAALEKGQSTTVFEDQNGQKIVSVAQETDQGWIMVSQQNYDEAYKVIQMETIKAIVLLVVTILAVSMVAYFISRWLTAPIRNLTEIADKYSQGHLNLTITDMSRKDEIGQLSQAIGRLGSSTRIALNRLRERGK